jgi:hypothetical protein
MFTDCESLETIILGKNVSNIDNFITLYCSKLKKIVCKAITAPTVEYRTFQDIASNGILEYPSGSDYSTWLSTDEYYLGYYGWTGMSVNFDDDNNNEDNEDDNGNDIVVPNNQKITYISSDGNIIIPFNVGGFGANIVSNTYKNGIGTITFDGTVNLFGDEVFYYCDTLTSITIPDSVTYIGSHAFDTCSSLSSISIPDSVTRIRNSTFQNCISLTSITIPDSVTFIGSYVFADSKIRKIKCKAITPPKVADTGTTFGWMPSGGVLEYPRGSDYSTWLNKLSEYGWTGSPY